MEVTSFNSPAEDGIVRKEPRRNIPRACEPCRQRKVKCNGKRPICGHCTDYKVDCFYGGTKKEATAKYSDLHQPIAFESRRLQDLEIRVKTYTTLLQGLHPFADTSSQLAIQSALASNLDPSISPALISSPVVSGLHVPTSVSDTESETSPEFIASPTRDAAANGLDGNANSNANNSLGFMGKGSGIALLRRVERELGNDKQAGEELGFNTYTRCSAYHLDRDVSQWTEQIDPFFVPSKQTANKLISAYLTTVHPLFPIILEESLIDDVETIYRFVLNPAAVSVENCNWTTLNLVFAIGQTFLSLLGEDEPGDIDHANYFMRARVLGALDGVSGISTATLEQLQAWGLTSMYLLASQHTNKSWNIAGLAVRMAYGIGLHVKIDTPDLDIRHQELRLRVWHSLCYLDSVLHLATGRPSAIQERACNAPVPRMLRVKPVGRSEEIDPTAPDPYMVACTSLSAITTETMTRLYSPRSQFQGGDNLENIRRDIELLDCFLQRWKKDLPESLDFQKSQTDQIFIHQRIDLAFRYHNTMMIMNRPCLRRPDHDRYLGVPPSFKEFARDAAVNCLESAQQIVTLIVHGLAADPTSPIRMGPWWCLLHYAVSATSIILLELTYGAAHAPHRCSAMFDDASNLISWLDAISFHGKNEGARKCCDELSNLLRQIAPRLNRQFVGPVSGRRRNKTVVAVSQDSQQQDGGIGESDTLKQYFPAPNFLHEPGSSGYQFGG